VAGVTERTVFEHALAYEVNCSILFTELPLPERPAAAKEAGFDAVEFWWPFATAVPSDDAAERFIRSVADAGVRLVGLNFFAGDMPGGDRGLVSWPARSGEFRDNVEVTIGIGERLGCRAFNALYGNRVEGADPAAQDDLAVENLAIAGRAAARIGGTVLVEPVSGAPRYPLRTAADAVGVIDRVAGETGVGNLDRYLGALAGAGYNGWVGLEYVPSGGSADSFAWLPHERRGAA
jgi:hydroxypyruvate isomerase